MTGCFIEHHKFCPRAAGRTTRDFRAGTVLGGAGASVPPLIYSGGATRADDTTGHKTQSGPVAKRRINAPSGRVQAGKAGPLDNVATRFLPDDRDRAVESRRNAYMLRDTAAIALPAESVRYCGRRVARAGREEGVVSLRLGERGASLTGVMTCGSVWHCPVCARRIAGYRREQVRRAVDRHRNTPTGEVYMITLTVPHDRFDDPKALCRAVAETWRKTIAGAPWMKWRKRLRAHLIRALEVTHGDNGWHPHLHVLLFVSDEVYINGFSDWLFARWASKVAAAGLGVCSPDAFRFERAKTIDAAADYIAKGIGADWELTHAHIKRGRDGGRTPFQLLGDGAAGDDHALRLFQAFAIAFKGARQLTWSKGLKDLYDVDDPSDEELAARAEPGRVIAIIYTDSFEILAQHGEIPKLLEATEKWGAVGLINFMASRGQLSGVKLCPTTPGERAA